MINYDDKDLGIIALLLIAVGALAIGGSEAYELAEKVVIAIGSLVTGISYQKTKE